ncbi:hypothetical protein E2C01_013465 [Portunus trituberculatus]|uniref:Uncharacterized protein n=1 Tax=Portunus trituberculatus TaxID=210409 RepID=A0A5B7DH62_PORTR|nr:hypothetical protein [Portunus trituberculatus]
MFLTSQNIQLITLFYGNLAFNTFSTMVHFHIHSTYYLVILYSFRNLCGD